MPALRKWLPSVPPADITEISGTPGQKAAETFSMAPRSSRLSGEGGLNVGSHAFFTAIFSSAMTRMSVF
jgi:hypothetical protein